jgi:hypothetical protein
VEPVDVTIQGMALNNHGISANNTVEGLGLNTFGFLWPCDGIWGPAESAISTTWTSFQGSSSVEYCQD